MSRALLQVVLAAALVVPVLGADEGWRIDRFASRIDVRPDGTFGAVETIDVDFRGLSRHGIFRDIDYVFDFDATRLRKYDIKLLGVTGPDGRSRPVSESDEGPARRFKIGDPNVTVSGRETYKIGYTVAHALNAFPDHDELYWNATGVWPVAISSATIVVGVPGDAITRIECFEGVKGSTERCTSRMDRSTATFTSTRSLDAGEQLTIVVGIKKGAVAEPQPQLFAEPRHGASQLFESTPAMLTGMFAGFVAAIGGVLALWWRRGRDRRAVALHMSAAGAEEKVPLFGARPIAVEFDPPDKIRPAQMGLLLDERADTVDVTATILDLAVRGYLTLTELPKQGWFGHKDWRLDLKKPADAALLPYERIVLEGLFGTGSSRTLSDLKNKFYKDLARAKTSLYEDAVARQWFPRNPNTVRILWALLGVGIMIAGVFVMLIAGRQAGGGLLALPIIAGGLLLTILARAMPRRSPAGTEITERTLGFVRYIKTAETNQQAFAERANIFTEFLPYAIAFNCVHQWARAFQGIDMQAATAGWYVGSSPFNLTSFTGSLSGLSSAVSSTIASTPGGSGHSGFSGGSSGGGGGGGGGGSW